MIVISDTTPISNFIQIDKLYLLKDIYEKIIIPQEVYNELMELEEFGFSMSFLIESDWISIETPQNTNLIQNLSRDLDLGEVQAIVLAIEKTNSFLLIDEKQGRSEAERLNIPIIGTLGVLLIAKERGMITEIEPSLEKLREIGFWISDNLYNYVLRRANE